MIDMRGKEPRDDSEKELREKIFEILKSLNPDDVKKLANEMGFEETQKQVNDLYNVIAVEIFKKKIGQLPVLMASARMIHMVLSYTRMVKGKSAFDFVLQAFIHYLNDTLNIKLEIKKEREE